MLNLDELQQLAAFARLGTLSRVAEEFHISSPSVTRSMQNLEECFGVSLFARTKNKIQLNETGKMAAACAKKLLQEAGDTIRQVQAFDLRLKTIVIKSCAPAPLWKLLQKLEISCPGKTISSHICQNEEVLAALREDSCDLAILPFSIQGSGLAENHIEKEFMREALFVCVPPEHELASRSFLTFEEINGFNFLLRSELGFWDTLCRKKMPASRFLVQTDEFTFNELVKSSSLPCFATDVATRNQSVFPERVMIPITDAEAVVTFYLVWRDGR